MDGRGVCAENRHRVARLDAVHSTSVEMIACAVFAYWKQGHRIVLVVRAYSSRDLKDS